MLISLSGNNDWQFICHSTITSIRTSEVHPYKWVRRPHGWKWMFVYQLHIRQVVGFYDLVTGVCVVTLVSERSMQHGKTDTYGHQAASPHPRARLPLQHHVTSTRFGGSLNQTISEHRSIVGPINLRLSTFATRYLNIAWFFLTWPWPVGLRVEELFMCAYFHFDAQFNLYDLQRSL